MNNDRRVGLSAIQRWVLFCGAGLLLSIAGGLTWLAHEPRALLPANIVGQITDFTPYFYKARVPAGYSLDTKHITYDEGALIIPLTQKNGQNLVITEQPLANLSGNNLLSGNQADKVENISGQASISKVEGRMVGTLLPPDGKTLVLLNTSGSANENDLIALIQGLQAVH